MIVRRLLPTVAITAGFSFVATAQTPATNPPATNPPAAATPMTPQPTTPPATTPPTAPVANPDIDKGIECLSKNDVEGCLKHFKAACDKDNKLPPPKVILAEYLFKANSPQAARLFLEQAGAEDAEHPSPYILSAAVAVNEGRLMDGMLLFERAFDRANLPRWNVEQRAQWLRACREGLANCYASRSNYKGAFEQLRAILETEPKNAVVRVQVARLLFADRQFELALKELERAHADDPNNPRIGLPEVNMAMLWSNRTTENDKAKEAENLAKAEEWYKKALEKYGSDARAPREFGRWLLNQGRVQEADTQLSKAASLDPKDKESRALTGLSCRYKKQFDEAEKIFTPLTLEEYGNIFYAWNLALAKAESPLPDTRKQAVAIAQQQQQAQSKNPEAAGVLAWCLFKAERVDDAERAMVEAMRLGGGNQPPSDTLYFFARILEKKGKGAEARDLLKKAVDSKSAFVYRSDATALHKDLLAKHPVVEEKKP